MKALRYHGRHDIRIDDVEEPRVQAGMVGINVDWCGICGSDLHEYYEGPISVPAEAPNPVTGETLPITMGHEFAGIVTALGEGADGIQVGDQVCVEPLIYCHRCAACSAGDYHRCSRLAIIGIHGIAGGFSTMVAVPRYAVHRLPPGISTELGALVEPLAVGWHAMGRADFRAGQTALVVGAGPIGLATLLCVQAAGALFAAVSVRRDGGRKQAAVGLNADAVLDSSQHDVAEQIMDLTNGRGVDVVFETAGTEEAMDTALDSVRAGGTVVSLAAWATKGLCDYQKLLLKEVRLTGSMCYSNAFPGVIKALVEGRIRSPEQMITKRISLDDVVTEGFDVLLKDKGQHVKILVKP